MTSFARELEMMNPVNRCHRRCVIGMVRAKPPLVQELERLARKNREAYNKALRDFRDAFTLGPMGGDVPVTKLSDSPARFAC